jgi:hypothetical protein
LSLTYGGKDAQTAATVAEFVNGVDIRKTPISQWGRLAAAADACLAQGRTTAERALALVEASASSELDQDAFLSLSKMRTHLKGYLGWQVENILRPLIVSFWQGAIEDDIRENGILSDLFSDDEVVDGERRVEETVEEILAEYGIQFGPADVNAIAARVDVASEIESNREHAEGEDHRSEWQGGGWSGVDAVDDLFHVDGPLGGRGPT